VTRGSSGCFGRSLNRQKMIPPVRDNFDAVRLIASLTVLYGHAYPLTGTVGPALFGNSLPSLAVKVFFVVSGFLVSESWCRDPSVARYLIRRALRIFPALVMVIVFSVLVAGPILTNLSTGGYFSSPGTWRYLSNILFNPSYMLPGVFETNVYPVAVNGSLWSLPVEFAMYLTLPLMAFAGRGLALRILLGCLVLGVISLYVVRVRVDPAPVVFYGTNIKSALDIAPYFLLGAMWQVVLPRRFLSLQLTVLILLMLWLVPAHQIAQEIGLYVVLPYAVLSFATARPACFGLAGRLGDFSYGIYVYGFLIEQTVSHYLKTDGRPLSNFGLSLFPTLLLAAVSWHLIERPFIKLKPKARGRTNPATAHELPASC
jgi:peptidoglycan/LPS O-acetylase OafA/YrhL